MKIVFWGTPEYAVPTLESLFTNGHEIAAVITNPDKRRSRGSNKVESPVKHKALELGLNVITTDRVKNNPDLIKELNRLKADVFIVVAFGQILPEQVLKIPKMGSWNGHASLLPKLRGAGPIQWSIINGEKITGVCIMQMQKGLDTGPILIKRTTDINLNDNALDLSNRLSHINSELFLIAIKLLEKLKINNQSELPVILNLTDQDSINQKPTYARMISKTDFVINWDHEAINIHRKIMGLFPNAFTIYNGKRVKIKDSEPLVPEFKEELSLIAKKLLAKYNYNSGNIGTIIGVEKGIGIIVKAKNGSLLIKQAQVEGKATMTGDSMIQQLKPILGGLINKEENRSV